MSVLDFPVAELTALFFDRIYSHAAGAPVRALLGDGADSVISALELAEMYNDSPNTAINSRKTPYLALRGGPITPDQIVLSKSYYRWIIYDTPDQGYWRINTIIPLLGRAYATEPRIRVVGGKAVGPIEAVDASSELPDTSGLLMRWVMYTMRTT